MNDFDIDVRIGADHVAVVEFSHGKHNFLNGRLTAALAATCEKLAEEGEARAILLCSSGRHFCAGADFSDSEQGDFFAEVKEGEHPYDAMVRILEQPLPIVAACQGVTTGGGLGIALLCDFRFASPESRFAAPFARLGMHQGSGISVTLPRVIGQQNTRDLMYTGRRIDGTEAHAIGLVDRLASVGDLRATAHAHAAEIAATAPITLRSIRATLSAELVAEVRVAIEHEKVQQALQRATADHAEGIDADLNRRVPIFQGR